ncbi:ABC transporter G family member 35-like protein [Tanacetum coccineum]
MRYAHGLNIEEHVNGQMLALENKSVFQTGGSGLIGFHDCLIASKPSATMSSLPPDRPSDDTDKSTNLGFSVLRRMDVLTLESTYWINAFALLGFIFLFNILFTMSLMFMEALGKPQAIISEEEAAAKDGHGAEARSRNATDGDANGASIKGMVLPFTPLAMSFDNMNYYVDMPRNEKTKVTEDRLQLLRDVTGAFRPGVLTALMGVSGAGKPTLMDVLAGRKTGGYIEGDIRISGFPKVQETFARTSRYCEQNDLHSPTIAIHESLIFSTFLHLPKEVSPKQKMYFALAITNTLKTVRDQLIYDNKLRVAAMKLSNEQFIVSGLFCKKNRKKDGTRYACRRWKKRHYTHAIEQKMVKRQIR